ncbi:hypothetical protein SFRURICE_005748 [Spodoptera frugiperda]|nr:hypothetical protein SFRURICE_005748 [Spodoptera frugiperda]
MGAQKWCLLIPMFLASVRAGLNDNVAQSFYETPQSSSPAPVTSTQHPAQRGMKEIVLFLTPDQVDVLQAAGAVVQPYPEYESDFAELQERFRQSIEYENQMPHQVWMNSSDDIKQNPDILEDYYKLLNIQEINDDLSHHPMLATTTETTTETPTTTTTTPKYKYTKARQQYKDKEYSTPYTPKKANRQKTNNQNNDEQQYVRFLPTYESENLQMVPFDTLPLPGYTFGVQTEFNMQTTGITLPTTNTAASTQLQINPEINDPAEITTHVGVTTETQVKTSPQQPERIQPIANTAVQVEPQQILYTPVHTTQRNNYSRQDLYRPVKIRIKLDKQTTVPPQTQSFLEITPKPTPTPQSYLESQYAVDFKKTLSSLEGLRTPPEVQQEKPKIPPKPLPTAPTPVVHQDKLAVLLAPLYKHHSITETITHQKQELLNGEFRIRSKLQEMKDSHNYNHQAYTVAVDNLNRNLGQQNALAKLEASRVSNSGQSGILPLELASSTEYPTVIRIPQPQEVKIPAPYPSPPDFMKLFKAPKPVDNKRGPHYQGGKNYLKLERPQPTYKEVPRTERYLIPTRIPVNVQEPVSYVIRHIWEH